MHRCITLAALSLATAVAFGNTRVYNQTYSIDRTNFAALTIPKFRPSLGTLNSVTIQYVSDSNCHFNLEQLNPTPAPGPYFIYSGTARARVMPVVQIGTSPMIDGVRRVIDNVPYDLDAFDGVVDFNGTSGIYLLESMTIRGSQTFTNPGVLASVTGVGTVSGNFGLMGSTLIIPSHLPRGTVYSNFAWDVSDIHIRITYDYTP